MTDASRVAVCVVAVIAMLAAASAIETFGDLAEFVREGDEDTWIDGAVVRALADLRTPWLTDAFLAITTIGTGAALAGVAVVVGGALAVLARSVIPPLLVLLAAAGTAVSVFSVKHVVARPRPAHWLAAALEDGYGFPSGHAANTTAVYLMLAAVTVIAVRTTWVRVTAAAVAVAVSVAVGVSRVVLGVHSPTDVLAGWVLGASWVIAVAAGYALVRNLPAAVDVLRRGPAE